MHVYLVIVGALAVWRITHLLSHENGPAKVLTRLRNSAVDGFSKRLFGCFYCLSLWIAAPLALWLGQDWKEEVLLLPALSGAAILLERITVERPPVARGFYVEEREDEHVLR
jgi:hypothetical protein